MGFPHLPADDASEYYWLFLLQGLLGDRYGHRPLPRLIEEKEFEALIAQLTGDPSATQLLTLWYWKDENAIPSVYVLQPLTDHLPRYQAATSQAQHKGDVEAWRSVERDLALALRLAAQKAEKHGLISQEQRHRYDKSGVPQHEPMAISKQGSPLCTLVLSSLWQSGEDGHLTPF